MMGQVLGPGGQGHQTRGFIASSRYARVPECRNARDVPFPRGWCSHTGGLSALTYLIGFYGKGFRLIAEECLAGKCFTVG